MHGVHVYSCKRNSTQTGFIVKTHNKRNNKNTLYSIKAQNKLPSNLHMDKQKSIRPERDCVARYSAIKMPAHGQVTVKGTKKLIPLSVLLLQCGAFVSPKSPRTSRWCWENGWCCPVSSSTTAASSSGPRTAWHSALERVFEVKKKKMQLHPAAEIKVKKGNNSATVLVQFGV